MQDKHEAIISTINSITSSLTSLRELLKDPSDVYFGRLHPAFEHLETVMSKKTTVDAAPRAMMLGAWWGRASQKTTSRRDWGSLTPKLSHG